MLGRWRCNTASLLLPSRYLGVVGSYVQLVLSPSMLGRYTAKTRLDQLEASFRTSRSYQIVQRCGLKSRAQFRICAASSSGHERLVLCLYSQGALPCALQLTDPAPQGTRGIYVQLLYPAGGISASFPLHILWHFRGDAVFGKK
jgi:hypothetical protein